MVAARLEPAEAVARRDGRQCRGDRGVQGVDRPGRRRPQPRLHLGATPSRWGSGPGCRPAGTTRSPRPPRPGVARRPTCGPPGCPSRPRPPAAATAPGRRPRTAGTARRRPPPPTVTAARTPPGPIAPITVVVRQCPRGTRPGTRSPGGGPAVGPGHGRVAPGLVQEHQPRGRRGRPGQHVRRPGGPGGGHVRPATLGRRLRLFFARAAGPARPAPGTRGRRSRPRRPARPAGPAVRPGSRPAAREPSPASVSRAGASTRLANPPACGRGATDPARSRSRTSRPTLDGLTANRRAAASCVAPPSTAATTRSRKSIDNGFMPDDRPSLPSRLYTALAAGIFGKPPRGVVRRTSGCAARPRS